MYVIYLTAAAELPDNSLHNGAHIVLDNIGLHGISVLRRLLDDRHIAYAAHSHIQCTRNRRCRKHQHINSRKALLELLLMSNSEALLLVDYGKSQILEDNGLLVFNLDTKENGGIFSQSQGWLILAEALLGHGDRAFEYFLESSPAAMNDKAEIRVMEPYVHGQFTESKASPYEGRSHVHWLTGTASTVMVGCVEGICGMRPDLGGLAIAPSIPAKWDGFRIEKNFRGKKLSITIDNSAHVQSGVKELTLNGEKLAGNYVPADKLAAVNEIKVVMG